MHEPTPEIVNVLVESHRQFQAFIARRVENAADAEDILQAALARGVEKSDSIRDTESVVAWFYRLLRNAITDYYRHRDVEQRALKRVGGFSAVAEEPDLAVEQAICQCVFELLPTINEEYATLLQRVDLEEASIAEVAAEMGMTKNNVRVKLHRARAALRKQLELCCGSCTEHGCLDCTCDRSSHHHHHNNNNNHRHHHDD
jgi:RNA polymerase sigma-70 factor (ECF subfamily)